MAVVDTDHFGDHDKTDVQPNEMGKTIPVTPGRATLVHEMSFGGTSLRREAHKEYVNGLYQKLYKSMGQTPEAIHFDNFQLRDGELYYNGTENSKNRLLSTKRGKLISTGVIAEKGKIANSQKMRTTQNMTVAFEKTSGIRPKG